MSENDNAPGANLEATDQTATSAVGDVQLVKGGQGALRPFPVSPSEALEEIEVSGVRGNSMTLLRTMVSMLEAGLKEARERIVVLEGKIESTLKEYNERDKAVAVLERELENVGKLKLLQSVLLTVGGIINGIGVKYLMDGKALGLIALAVGCLLLIAGWLWPLGAKRNV
jgi:hypothetical protein